MEENRERQIPPFLKSLFLHALILGLIFYVITLEQEESDQKSEPIQIESINSHANPKKSVKKTERPKSTEVSKSHSTVKSQGPAHAVSLSDLGMRLDTNPQAAPTEYHSADEAPAPDIPEGDGWDMMNPDPRIARFNQYVYNKVQGWLDRDRDLNHDQIYGTVKVRIWFDADGNYLEAETVYDAIDPNFQKIVERALRKAFNMPIPHPYLYLNKKFSIERMVVIRKY